MNRLMAFMILGSTLTACGLGTTPSVHTLSAQMEAAAQNEASFLGSGYQSDTRQFTDTDCVSFTGNPQRNLTKDGLITAGFNYSLSDLENFFGGSVTTTFPIFPGVSATGSIGLRHDHIGDETSETLSVLYRGVGASESIDDNQVRLSPRIEGLLNDPEFKDGPEDRLYRLCGDRYLKGMERGIIFMATLKAIGESSLENNSIHGSVSLGISKIGSGALSFIDKLMPKVEVAFSGGSMEKELEVHYKLQVFQKGGRPERLLKLLPGDAAGSGALVCTRTERELCLQAFRHVMEYIQSDLPKQMDKFEHLAPIGFLQEDYVHPRLEALAPSPARAAARAERLEQLVNLRRPLATLWDETESDLQLLKQSRQSLEDLQREIDGEATPCPEAPEDSTSPYCQILRKLDDLAKKQDLLDEALSKCEAMDSIEACAAEQKKVLQEIAAEKYQLDREQLRNLPQSFSTFCQLSFNAQWLPFERQRTVHALLELAQFPMDKAFDPAIRSAKDSGFSLADACYQADRTLRSMSSLALKDAALKDLLPIASLSSLTELDLQGNNVETMDLKPLVWLPRLQNLNLQNNLLQGLAPLRTLPRERGESLNLLGNPILDTAPIREEDWRWNQTLTDPL